MSLIKVYSKLDTDFGSERLIAESDFDELAHSVDKPENKKKRKKEVFNKVD